MGTVRIGVVSLVLVMAGCDGSSDSGDGSREPDASSVNPDASGSPDGSSGIPDASSGNPDGSSDPDGSRGADASPTDATPGGECPPLDGEGGGVTPGWVRTIASEVPDPQSPASAILLSVDDAPDCSFVTGGYSRAGSVVLGQGEPAETTIPADVWFVARYQASGALAWAVDLGAHDGTADLMTVRMLAGGDVAVIRELGSVQTTLQHLSADGVVLDEPRVLDGYVVHPLADGGAYVARPGAMERIGASGEVLWVRGISSSPQSIAELSDGRVVHAGAFEFGGTVLNGGQPDEQVIDTQRDGCYVALYGSDGSLEWVRTIDLAGIAVPACAAAGADSWVAAWVTYPIDDWAIFRIATGSGPPIETSLRNSVVVRYQDTGELTWAYTTLEAAEESFLGFGRESLSVDAERGTATVGGRVDGGSRFDRIFPAPSVSAELASEPDQGWFARFGADGSIVGPVGLSSEQPGESSVNATATRADGSAILAGHFSGTLVLGPFQVTPEGGFQKGFVAEVH